MKHTILVVDDHPQLREVVRTMLESRGYVVALAGDGATAIAAFEHTHFDAALIDVDMPGLTGVELVRELRRICEQSHRPFRAALMTGVPRTELHASAEQAGASCVLAKPFPMAELILTVERLCGDRATVRHAA